MCVWVTSTVDVSPCAGLSSIFFSVGMCLSSCVLCLSGAAEEDEEDEGKIFPPRRCKAGMAGDGMDERGFRCPAQNSYVYSGFEP